MKIDEKYAYTRLQDLEGLSEARLKEIAVEKFHAIYNAEKRQDGRYSQYDLLKAEQDAQVMIGALEKLGKGLAPLSDVLEPKRIYDLLLIKDHAFAREAPERSQDGISFFNKCPKKLGPLFWLMEGKDAITVEDLKEKDAESLTKIAREKYQVIMETRFQEGFVTHASVATNYSVFRKLHHDTDVMLSALELLGRGLSPLSDNDTPEKTKDKLIVKNEELHSSVRKCELGIWIGHTILNDLVLNKDNKFVPVLDDLALSNDKKEPLPKLTDVCSWLKRAAGEYQEWKTGKMAVPRCPAEVVAEVSKSANRGVA